MTRCDKTDDGMKKHSDPKDAKNHKKDKKKSHWLKDVKLLSLPTRQEVSLPGIEDHCSNATTFPVPNDSRRFTTVPFLFPFAHCVISYSFMFLVIFHRSSPYFTTRSNDVKRQIASCQTGNKLWFYDVSWTLQIHVNVLKTSRINLAWINC